MIWTEELIRSLHREHIEDGVSLAAIGRRYHVSRQAISQKFEHYGLPRRGVGDHARQERERQVREAENSRARIIALYKERGSIDEVHAEVALPRDLVTAIIDEIPNRESYRRRGDPAVYSRDDLIAALRQAAQEMGEPLTVPNYRTAARRLGLPTLNIQVRHFSREADEATGSWWLAALNAAGVKGNLPRGRRASTLTEDDCIAAVTRYVAAHDGQRGSYDGYCKWAATRGEPSGSALRLRLPWNELVNTALDRVGAT